MDRLPAAPDDAASAPIEIPRSANMLGLCFVLGIVLLAFGALAFVPLYAGEAKNAIGAAVLAASSLLFGPYVLVQGIRASRLKGPGLRIDALGLTETILTSDPAFIAWEDIAEFRLVRAHNSVVDNLLVVVHASVRHRPDWPPGGRAEGRQDGRVGVLLPTSMLKIASTRLFAIAKQQLELHRAPQG